MYKLDEVMIDRLENRDFTVKQYDFEIDFGKYTSAGQDFHIYAMHCRNLSDVIEDLKQQYKNYDPSYETSLEMCVDKMYHRSFSLFPSFFQ